MPCGAFQQFCWHAHQMHSTLSCIMRGLPPTPASSGGRLCRDSSCQPQHIMLLHCLIHFCKCVHLHALELHYGHGGVSAHFVSVEQDNPYTAVSSCLVLGGQLFIHSAVELGPNVVTPNQCAHTPRPTTTSSTSVCWSPCRSQSRPSFSITAAALCQAH